ncbi:uncharacterized protein LOC113334036 [Papaver somniferum]|uniref:uncharacterized protein LOC113334036 n=1 Tax=Papaver somniferum TaxID=3469 RepID=UPI000E6FC065|nr:uncharacterized protein LOC113334036 [Papaver somniferum]
MVDIPLPENVMPPTYYDGEIYANLGVWGDNICVAFVWGLVRSGVWVMQQYGVRESCIRKCDIITTERPPCRWFSDPYWKPLWCFDNGEILVDFFCSELLLYDPPTERVKSVVVHDIIMDDNPESYVESIVSLNSGVTEDIESRTLSLEAYSSSDRAP